MKTKFKIGQRIRYVDDWGEYVEGHVVLIMNPSDPIYYCSMYPGAMSGYEWVYVIDLNGTSIDDDGKIETLQALNKFKESELEFASIAAERKEKLNKINDKENETD